MSEIENVGYIWMALNSFACNHLMPSHFEGLVEENGVVIDVTHLRPTASGDI